MRIPTITGVIDRRILINYRIEAEVLQRYLPADGTSLAIEAQRVEEWHAQSVFNSLKEASSFFENGSVGYSPNCFDGLELNTFKWEVAPLKVDKVYSSFFSDESIFPKGSVTFDNALLMENIPHEWRALPILRSTRYRV